MALVYADRVKETSATTGTGSMSLAGAVTGFQAFSAVLANSDTCYYTITDGTDWEVGYGTYTTSGAVLARTSVIDSSNAGSAVNWTAATEVFLTHAAAITASTVLGNTGVTDNRVVRYDGTSGLVIQESPVAIDDSGNLTGIGNIALSGTVDGVDIAAEQTRLADTSGTNTGDQTYTDLGVTGTPTSSKYLRGDGTWNTPTNTTYSEISTAEIDAGTASASRALSGRRSEYIVDKAVGEAATYTDAEIAALAKADVGLANVDNTSDATKLAATLAAVYPIGSIYTETSGVNPNTTFGFGTWTAFGSGRVPVGYDSGDTDFNTAEETGGAKTLDLQHNHDADTMAAHMAFFTAGSRLYSDYEYATTAASHPEDKRWYVNGSSESVGGLSESSTAGVKVSGATDNALTTTEYIVQPYIVVHMWKRTA